MGLLASADGLRYSAMALSSVALHLTGMAPLMQPQ